MSEANAERHEFEGWGGSNSNVRAVVRIGELVGRTDVLLELWNGRRVLLVVHDGVGPWSAHERLALGRALVASAVASPLEKTP